MLTPIVEMQRRYVVWVRVETICVVKALPALEEITP